MPRIVLYPCQNDTLCGFDRPEDVSRLPASSWALVSQHGDNGLVWVNLETGDRIPVTTEQRSTKSWLGEDGCLAPDMPITARGNALARIDGRNVAAVINTREQGEFIEFFEVAETRTPDFRWAGRVSVPDRYFLNDITIASDGSIYGSHMFDRLGKPADFPQIVQKFEAAENTGFAVSWSARHGWNKVPGTDMSLPNGIPILSDRNQLAVGGTFEQAVLVINLP